MLYWSWRSEMEKTKVPTRTETPKFTVGDRVRYSAEFLRSTDQYTGIVPFARGVIRYLAGRITTIATIEWDNPVDLPIRVNTFNLEKTID
jgi:hypothetical protein